MNFKPRVFFLELLKIGALGFGGPLVTSQLMKKAFVDKLHWVDEKEFLERMGLCKLLPGPFTSLLAVMVGRRLGGSTAALLGLLAFVLPSFFLIILFSFVGNYFSSIPSLQNWGVSFLWCFKHYLFWVLLVAAFKLMRDAWNNFEASIVIKAIYFFLIILASFILSLNGRAESEILFFTFVLAIAVYAFFKRSYFKLNAVEPLGFLALYLFFLKASLVVFGTGYMIFPYIERLLVQGQYLSAADFEHGLLLGNISPGPVIIAATYYGLKMGGFWGAVLATAGVFSGPVILALILYPVLEKLRKKNIVRHLSLSIVPAVVIVLLKFNTGLLSSLSLSFLSFFLFIALVLMTKLNLNFAYQLLVLICFSLLRVFP